MLVTNAVGKGMRYAEDELTGSEKEIYPKCMWHRAVVGSEPPEGTGRGQGHIDPNTTAAMGDTTPARRRNSHCCSYSGR